MKHFWEWITEAKWLKEAEMQGGFWTGSTESGASGLLCIAQNTAQICIALRSADTHSRVGGKTVHTECWGTIGGAVDDADPITSAKNEVEEETGFTGPYIKVVPGYVFRSGNFVYRNYIAVVPHEFQFAPQSGSHWETVGLAWAKYEKLTNAGYQGHPMHDGLVALLQNSADIIKEIIAGLKQNLQTKKQGFLPGMEPEE